MPCVMAQRRYAILGTVGVPAAYGGFETLAENLARYHAKQAHPSALVIYCSGVAFEEQPANFVNARLRYLPLNANGPQSILYDLWSLFSAAWHRTDVILLLGVSGALGIPILRMFSRARIITNIDGIEWKRAKWSGLAKRVLRWSEHAAVRWSHEVVADNQAIADYVNATYDRPCRVITYGGDHALATPAGPGSALDLPAEFALALCRIEPENNVAMILAAFTRMDIRPLVFIGNWDNSDYGRELKAKYKNAPNLLLCDPIYDPPSLRHVRDRAAIYVHGHSAGGTNPSLVEMMHFGLPVIAYDCEFNRYTTNREAAYFRNADELVDAVEGLDAESSRRNGARMAEIARERYTWDKIGAEYFELMERA